MQASSERAFDSTRFRAILLQDSVQFHVIQQDSASSLARHNKESLKQLEALLS